jgi:hypothetical protein
MDNPHRGKHYEFIESNRELFTRETPLAYQRSGRGFWFAMWPERPDAHVALQYHDAGGLEVLQGETRRAVSRMVHEYDPSWQVVVVIAEQDDSIRAYKTGFVDPSGN